MTSQCLTILGLLLDIVGVAIVWRFGWPQPNLEPGVGLGLEDGTPYGPKGETVADHNRRIAQLRLRYRRTSAFGLILIILGFCFQLVAQLL